MPAAFVLESATTPSTVLPVSRPPPYAKLASQDLFQMPLVFVLGFATTLSTAFPVLLQPLYAKLASQDLRLMPLELVSGSAMIQIVRFVLLPPMSVIPVLQTSK